MNLFYFGLILIMLAFILNNFRFVGIIIILEVLNVLVLLSVFLYTLNIFHVSFLVFMVVATVEAALALIILTRLWEQNSLV